jgi:hypothetical protein
MQFNNKMLLEIRREFHTSRSEERRLLGSRGVLDADEAALMHLLVKKN